MVFLIHSAHFELLVEGSVFLDKIYLFTAQLNQALPQEAQAPQPGGGEAAPGGGWMPLVFFALMILVFWLLIIRPQQKRNKQHQAFLKSLQKGDSVVTNGGIIGKIASISGEVVTLEVSKDVRIRTLKGQISGHFKDEGTE